jgi:hypothetical protein
MRFAKITYTVAGIYGLLILAPHYLAEQMIGRDHPPAITHSEYFYGFLGVAIAWQVGFLIIGSDPLRYRPLMIACMIEKFSFAAACTVLYLQGRLAGPFFAGAMIDLLLGTLFVVAFLKTRPATS